MRIFLVASMLATMSGPLQAQPACPFTKSWSYHETSLLRAPDQAAYLFASSRIELDADGSPNAYHPDDTRLNCPTGVGFKGLDCPANAGYRGPHSKGWKSVLLADPKNPQQPYVQESGEFTGYFLAMTALQDDSRKDNDPARYVDSRTVPYVVFPGDFYRAKGTGRMGDLGVAINLQTGAQSAFVVADVGPPHADLGEMSLALATALGGSDPNPRTGAGKPSGRIAYVVFPRSSLTHRWPLTPAELSESASQLLNGLGGTDVVHACEANL